MNIMNNYNIKGSNKLKKIVQKQTCTIFSLLEL